MTYLEMCQKLVRDLGLQDSVESVTDQVNMPQKIVDWIADADEYIQSLWRDWNFLWAQHSVATVVGTRQISKPSDWGAWDKDSMYLNYSSDEYIKLHEIDYLDWRRSYGPGVQENDEPHGFVILPNNNIYLEPAPDAVYTFSADYWKTVTRMSANTSTSAIPEKFQRIILAQAKIYYAEHEEFPTVFELANIEFAKLYKDLMAAELPGDRDKMRISKDVSRMRVVPE